MAFVTTLLLAVLGLAFVALGGSKLVGAQQMRDAFVRWHYLRWAPVAVGVWEVIGGLGLLAGIIVPPLAAFAALWLAVAMVGALGTELVGDRRPWRWVPPVVLLRPLGLQIALLPRLAPAPNAHVPAHEVRAFPSGTFLESIAFDQRGNYYVSSTCGTDALGAPSGVPVKGEIVRFAPDGTRTTFATLPIAQDGGVGCIAVAPDGALFVTANSPAKPDAQGVWRIAPTGAAELYASLPTETGPNGIALDPQGNLYVADANGGLVWRIRAGTEPAEPWLRHALLAKRPLLALFPGANGVQYHDGALFVAVSDAATIVRVPLLSGGLPGEPTIYASGVPTDDFAFDAAGTLYATTHPFNSVVRITPDGTRITIATAVEGVTGTTSAAFSTRPGESAALYVVGDGGLFGGASDAKRPAVVRLDVGRTGAP